MAFKTTISRRDVFGNTRVVMGEFSNGSKETGGKIATGMKHCNAVTLTPKGAAVAGAAVSAIKGGDVTIITDEGIKGTFIAFGS